MNPDTWAFDTHARLQDGRPSCLSLTLCHCHGRRTHLGLIRGCGYREPCGSAGQATPSSVGQKRGSMVCTCPFLREKLRRALWSLAWVWVQSRR